MVKYFDMNQLFVLTTEGTPKEFLYGIVPKGFVSEESLIRIFHVDIGTIQLTIEEALDLKEALSKAMEDF